MLDYGSGNIHSVRQAIFRLEANVAVSSNWDELDGCDGLLLPGVGAFAACMQALAPHAARIWAWVAAGRPLLGICVGHQVLFTSGDESGVLSPGLGLLPGIVERLQVDRLPHMGWDDVEPPPHSPMFSGVEGERFYFVHSFGVRAVQDNLFDQVAWCQTGGDKFVAGITHENIWGTQFHPEKSAAAGARLLSNWLGYIATVGVAS
ncbi:MAG: imidazole glycerol phosphate synthase subunit HisH [Micrococcales bacterium]|nr:imidazole glycerol phosphate synthase subunit HisH [Micrococcales bacterium]